MPYGLDEALNRLARLACKAVRADAIAITVSQDGIVAAGGHSIDEQLRSRVDALCTELVGGRTLAPGAIAIVRDGRVVGAVAAATYASRAWTADDEDELANVAALVAIELDRHVGTPELLAALAHRQQMYRAAFSQIPNGAMFLVDRDQRYVTADGPILAELLERVHLRELIGRTVQDVTTETEMPVYLEIYTRTLEGERLSGELHHGERTYEYNSVPLYRDGAVSHAMLFVYDVTDREREHALLDATLEHIQDGVVLLDRDRQLLLANRSYFTMFTLPPNTRLTRNEFIEHVCSLARDPAHARAALLRDALDPVEIEVVRPHRRVLRRTLSVLEAGYCGSYLVTWQDITAEVDLRTERERLAMIDALTGVGNRRAAERAFRDELEARKRNHQPISLVMLDIDRFKVINDLHGHNVGDDVLRQVAATLVKVARKVDTVVRWGGEEFLVILPTGVAGASSFAERARAAVEAEACGKAPRVTISLGVAELASGESFHSAIGRADAALYSAKRTGRNRVIEARDAKDPG